MSASELRRVMEPYARGDSHIAKKQVGTGLGLSLTRRLAELHGGTFRLESTPGVGTVATIALPHGEAAPGYGENLGVAA
jgi:signal transduction histidine kinase